MKKYLLVLMMILALSGVAFATDPPKDGDVNVGSGNTANGQGGVVSVFSPSATGGNATIGNVSGGAGGQGGAGGAGGSVTNTQVGGTFSPTFNPTNTVNVKPEINTNIGNGIGNFSPSAKATIEKGAVDIDNTNKNTNVNINKPVNIVDTDIKNTNKQGQSQSNTNTFNPVNTNTQGQDQTQSQKQKQQQNQGQGQGQSQNNSQTIAPSQEINISSPSRVAVGVAPNVTDTELNFISPNERDVQTILPKFGCGTVKAITVDDCIVDVLWQSNDIKFKDLYKEVLKGLRSDAVMKSNTKAVRYQIREAASTKTWTTGGDIGANTVGMIGNSVSGASGGIFPKVGRSKSSNLYTVIFVQVQDFK